MPAMLDDPDSPTIFRVSGDAPFPVAHSPSLPPDVHMHQVTLRDRQTVATIVPFASHHQVPLSLLEYLSDQLNKEIEGGDTYPMMEPLPVSKFASYWFQNFGAIMLLGTIDELTTIQGRRDLSKECLGSFYIKPNYPGRSSHVCNAGFLVTDRSRNRGVGRLMGEAYLDWAPRLGYTYSVFNLVYETNVASCRIWDALGFKRIGRVKGCGNLKSYPGRLIDAIIYGRDLGPDAEELQSDDRFDKIKFYLKYGKYPQGADRAEKSRLRSAAVHYKLLDGETLMHKDKEVVSDPMKQYEIAKRVHEDFHAGINKTTAAITEKYHWRSIKETASDVIKKCEECMKSGRTLYNLTSQLARPPVLKRDGATATSPSRTLSQESDKGALPSPSITPDDLDPAQVGRPDDILSGHPYGEPDSMATMAKDSLRTGRLQTQTHSPMTADSPHALHPDALAHSSMSNNISHPSALHHEGMAHSHELLQDHHHHHHHHHHPHHDVYQPIDPRIMADAADNHHSPFDLSSHAHHDTDFQSLLNDPDDDVPDAHDPSEDSVAVDGDLDMFVEQHPAEVGPDDHGMSGMSGMDNSIGKLRATLDDREEEGARDVPKDPRGLFDFVETSR